TPLAGVALDGPEHPRVGEAAAEHRGKRPLDLGVRSAGLPIQKRFRRQDDAAQAEPTLCGLLVDERPLNGMRRLRSAEPLERRDLSAVQRPDRGNTRSDRPSTDDDGTGATLSEAAAELGTTEREVVREDVEEGCRRIDVNGVGAAVDLQSDRAHFAPS